MPKTIYYDGADIDKIVAVYDPIGNYDAHWVTGQSMTKTDTATGSFTPGVDHRHHKIVDNVITEMDSGEKGSNPTPPVIPHGEMWQETPTGTIDGANDSFTLANPPLDLIMLFCNGILLEEGSGNDFQISGKDITFESGSEPPAGSKLLVRYRY